MSQLFSSGGQSTGVSASASVFPMNTQNWAPLGWTGWICLQFKGLSRVFSNTTVQKHQFFSAQLSSQTNSHIHTWPLEKIYPLKNSKSEMNYTVEVTNRFKGFDLISRVPGRTMDGGSWHCTKGRDQDHPQEKEMQKGKMVVWWGLTNRYE